MIRDLPCSEPGVWTPRPHDGDNRSVIGIRRTLPWWLLLVAACDRVFGLEDRDPLDAAGSEKATCPELGAGPPVFGSTIEELQPRSCFYFTLSQTTGLAYATCGNSIEEGPVDGPLQPSAIAPSLPGATLDRPGVAPEGDHLMIRQLGSSVQRMSWYARAGTTWIWQSDLIDGTGLTTPGVPSAAPDRRAIVASLDGYREFVEARDAWTELRFSPWTTLGVGGGAQPHLSPDGLRLTFVVGTVVMYADRPDRGSEFGIATPITTVGSTPSAFITEDCARAYYSTGGSIVFRRQL